MFSYLCLIKHKNTMKKTSFTYEISINVEISKENFDLLCEAFNSHKEVKRHIEFGGWMYGKKGRLDFDYNQGKTLELNLTDHQIDICCKAIELASLSAILHHRLQHEKYSKLYVDIFNLHKLIVAEHDNIKLALAIRAINKLDNNRIKMVNIDKKYLKKSNPLVKVIPTEISNGEVTYHEVNHFDKRTLSENQFLERFELVIE